MRENLSFSEWGKILFNERNMFRATRLLNVASAYGYL